MASLGTVTVPVRVDWGLNEGTRNWLWTLGRCLQMLSLPTTASLLSRFDDAAKGPNGC